MKLVKNTLSGLFLLAAFLFVFSCGQSQEGSDSSKEAPVKTETAAEENHDGHDHADHAGHDHDGHDHGAPVTSHSGKGMAYESDYVCPMHCKDSGSKTAGKCPVCKMDYVAMTEHVKDGHTHE